MDSEYILIAAAVVWVVYKLLPKKPEPTKPEYENSLKREQHGVIDYEAEKVSDPVDFY